MNTRFPLTVVLAGLLAGAAGSALAQGPEHHDRDVARRGGPGLRFDDRYHHDHYYPPHGYIVGALPGGSVSIAFGGGHYYFHSGVWYHPSGGRFVVIAPPIGIVVPLLPPSYVNLTIGGVPYYYANGTYYMAQPGQGYVVVAPPPGADVAQAEPLVSGQPVPVPQGQVQPQPQPQPQAQYEPPPPAAPPVAPVIYPRNGQSAAQTESDRRECNRWATTQPAAAGDASVFQRAVSACMDGRGYTLR